MRYNSEIKKKTSFGASRLQEHHSYTLYNFVDMYVDFYLFLFFFKLSVAFLRMYSKNRLLVSKFFHKSFLDLIFVSKKKSNAELLIDFLKKIFTLVHIT